MAQRTENCVRCHKQRGPQDTTHNSYCRECWRAYQRDRWHDRLPTMETQTCPHCGTTFTPKQRRPTTYCSRTCKERGSRRGRVRLPVAVYQRMLAEQDGRCAICGNAGELDIDHCHKTGRVRALLCGLCNPGLGNFRDDPALLRRAAEYLGG